MRLAKVSTSLTFLLALALAGCRSVKPENLIWDLVVIRGAPAQSDTDGRKPTLRLDATGQRAGGTTVCNGYSGPYTLKGDSLAFGPIVSTRRACVDAELNRQEAAFLASLGATRTWRANGDTLELHDETGVAAKFLER